MKKSIEELTAEIREINVAHGWRSAAGGPGTNTFGDYIALLHSEVSEALEAYRDHRLADATGPSYQEAMNPNLPELPKPEGVGSELADVFIRLVDMCDVFGIDLPFEIERKVAYNRTRPYQHGGRTVSDAGQA